MAGFTGLIIFIYYLVIFSFMIYLYGKYKVCPELMWCLMQLLMFFGITHFIDTGLSSDRQLILLYFIGLISFIISSSFFTTLSRGQRDLYVYSDLYNYKLRKPYLYIMMIVCIILCASFFSRGGGNVFINGLRAMLTGADYSVKYSRMGLLSVSGVGYIYQLRVIVFPLCVLYYIMINKKKISSIVLGILMLLFIIGTGQRGGLVSLMAIALTTTYYWMSSQKESRRRPIKKAYTYLGVIGVAGVLFGLSTIMNGRVASGGSVFSAILQRFVEDNQSSAVGGFRYINMQSIQNGRDWLQQFVDVLPGQNSYMSLATRIFAYMHGGSTAGTSPACIWGSSYYNFGILGVVVMGMLLGYITSRLHSHFTKKKCDELSVLVYSGLQFLLAYWVVDGPLTLFNNGFIAVLLFYWIMQIALKVRIVFGKNNYH